MSETEKLEIKAGLQVVKPIYEVYDAIIDPEKMKNYFISKSTGPMIEGSTVNWSFPEFEGSFPVKIGKMKENKYISYHWNDEDGTETFVEMKLTEMEPGLTYILITEKERDNDKAGINWLRRNTEGWANFLACLKAWMEYGINLRKKAFKMSQIDDKK